MHTQNTLEIGVSNHSIASSSDHLCEPGGSSSGGSVRFVDSTVRYHVSSGAYYTLWSSRSILERILQVAVLVLVIVISLLLITVGEYSQYYNKDGRLDGSKDRLCLSQECISVAATILSDIDPTVEPCKDFYKVRKGSVFNLYNLYTVCPV